jgi:hypothetical protein
MEDEMEDGGGDEKKKDPVLVTTVTPGEGETSSASTSSTPGEGMEEESTPSTAITQLSGVRQPCILIFDSLAGKFFIVNFYKGLGFTSKSLAIFLY